ncbi:DMT family transporter [Guggenheimella bovis]
MKKIGFIYAILSALIYGVMPLMTKGISSFGADPISISVFRMGILLPLMYVLCRFVFRYDIRVKRKEIIPLVLGGIFLASTNILVYSSYRYISSGATTAIHFMYPVLIFIATSVLLKDKPTKAELFSILLCTLGIIFIYDFKNALDIRGFLFAALSACTYTTYSIIIDKSSVKHYEPLKLAMYLNIFGAMTGIFFAYTVGEGLYTSFKGMQWVYLILFALALTLGATYLYQLAVNKIGSKLTSMLSTLEPITSLIVGTLVLKEALSPLQFLAAACILVSTVLLVTSSMKTPKES